MARPSAKRAYVLASLGENHMIMRDMRPGMTFMIRVQNYDLTNVVMIIGIEPVVSPHLTEERYTSITFFVVHNYDNQCHIDSLCRLDTFDFIPHWERIS
jgi:hypothetical protein